LLPKGMFTFCSEISGAMCKCVSAGHAAAGAMIIRPKMLPGPGKAPDRTQIGPGYAPARTRLGPG